MSINPTQIKKDQVLSELESVLPVSQKSINGIYIVGSFARDDKEIDSDSRSDIDIFLQVTDDAASISCVKGHYGDIEITTEDGRSTRRDVQFLTSRQPRVSIDSFDQYIRLL